MKKFFTSLFFSTSIFISLTAFSVPILNSYPAATATLFLDFDGHLVQSTVWNNGNPLNCAASGLTSAQITEAFYRVAEDYRPFNINVTTDSTVFLAAPLNRRMRIIITATSSWMPPGYGGVAYVGSFIWGDDTPAFVFSDRLGPFSPKMVGECISHESGHTVGLSHQSKYGQDCNTPTEPYNTGYGTGPTAWSPIMGNSYYRNMSNWNNGPTPWNCNDVQDNLTIIATQNGFGYRTDDYTEAMDGSTFTLPAGSFTADGIISTNADFDAFKFTLAQNSNFHLTAIPFNVSSNWIGANLDIKLELYSSPTNLVATFDPLTTMSILVDTILTSGTYYIRISGAGNSNISSYGSLGAYTIAGTSSTLPIHNVSLNGKADKGKHSLSWNITTTDPVKTIEVESSNDGSQFNGLTVFTGGSVNNYSYQPFKNDIVYYRLKVASVLGQVKYSNTIALRATGIVDKFFTVSTLVQNEIIINTAENYQYLLRDMNGRVILSGNGVKGISRLNVTGQSKGMYIIQLFNNDKRQTERIIKQ